MSQSGETCQLDISSVLLDHDGEYSCVTTNSAGMVTCAATLNIDGEFFRESWTIDPACASPVRLLVSYLRTLSHVGSKIILLMFGVIENLKLESALMMSSASVSW